MELILPQLRETLCIHSLLPSHNTPERWRSDVQHLSDLIRFYQTLKPCTATHNRTEKTWLWQHGLVIITFLWASRHWQGIWKELIAYPNIWAFEKICDHISICLYFHKSHEWAQCLPRAIFVLSTCTFIAGMVYENYRCACSYSNKHTTYCFLDFTHDLWLLNLY